MSDIGEETVPCETCGAPTIKGGTKRCDWCWEVESRLDGYLTRGGRRAQDFVAVALTRSDLKLAVVECDGFKGGLDDVIPIYTTKRFIMFVGIDYEGFESPSDAPSFDTVDAALESLTDSGDDCEIFDCVARRVIAKLQRNRTDLKWERR